MKGEETLRWDDPEQRAAIEQYLANRVGGPPTANALAAVEPALSPQALVTELADASQGNFMYVKYVLEDLLATGNLDLETLPRGLTRLSPALLDALVENRQWTPEQALAAAWQNPNDRDKALSLVRLARHFETAKAESLLREAFAFAAQEPDAYGRFLTFDEMGRLGAQDWRGPAPLW